MIPLRLQIKNFLSYGSPAQTINFEPYHLICLSGKNGHGKSALLDAITWALWGQARKVGGAARAEEGLLRLGHSYMLVALDFESNKQQYRVRREFSFEGSKAQTHLDFGIITQTGVFKTLTEKTIRSTQSIINQIVGLDYDSFINSVFLRQGQSNEFSKKSPKERKDILATILGLDKYEELRKRAQEKAKKILIDKEVLVTVQERLTEELSKKGILEQELNHNTEKLAILKQEEKQILARTEQYTYQKKTLELEFAQYNIIEFQQNQIKSKIAELTSEIINKVALWRAIHRKQNIVSQLFSTNSNEQKRVYEAALRAIETTKNRKTELQELLIRAKTEEAHEVKILTEHDKKIYDQEFLVKTTKTSLEELTLLEKNLDDEKKLLKEKLARVELALKQQEQSLEQFTMLEKQFEKRKNFYHLFIARGNRLQTTLKGLVTKKELTHDTNPSCPLCEQNLTPACKQFLHTKLTDQESLLVHQKKRLILITTNLKKIVIDQHTEIEALKKIHENKIQQEQLRQELIKNLIILEQKMQEQYQKKDEKKKLLAYQEEELARSSSLKLAYQEQNLLLHKDSSLQNYTQELANLSYNEQQYQELKNNLKLLQELELSRVHYEQNNVVLKTTKQEISHTIKIIKTLKKEYKEHEIKLKELKIIKQRYQDTLNLEEQSIREHKIVLTNREQLLIAHGALEQQHSLLQKHALEHELLEKKHGEYNKLLQQYQTIAHALSKDGIQALLIENAIPELEHDANELLARLTDNQAHLIIESLRDLKSGGTKETLDIKISDAIGIRPYELFSGGEAFRIDFALRIALSKLLARRAGTSLQTLIIDEGFGSQDEDGLAHIMDALYKIQDHFAKIIIVSHLPSMKEQFPVHFTISKGPQGSSVRVIEQG